MASKLINNVKITVLNSGTGALHLGPAVEGYRGVEALTNAQIYSYSIRQDAAFEFGRGTYLAAGRQLVRQPFGSSDGGTPINVQPGTQISFVALAEDLATPQSLYPLSGNGAPADDLGELGQFYRDLASADQLEYGPKTEAGWGAPRSLRGASGPSGSVSASLAALKGAATTDAARYFSGAWYVWRTDQDYSSLWNDRSVIRSNSDATGAWVRLNADGYPIGDAAADLSALDLLGANLIGEGTFAINWGQRVGPVRGISRKAKLLRGGAILQVMLAHAAGLHATNADLGWQGNLTTAQIAITSASIKIAIVGDSISQGRAQITSLDAGMVRVCEAIQRQLGRCSVTFANFSIAGRGAGELNSDSYTGKSSGATDASNFNEAEIPNIGYPNYVVFPGGTTAGKTWKAHVKDWTPDMLVIALGINDTNDPRGFAGSLRSFLANYVPTWNPVPSVVLCTPYAPSYRRGYWDAFQSNIATNAAAVRSLARELGHSVVDVGRISEVMRSGVDPTQPQHRRVAASTYPTGWATTTGAAPSNAAGVVTFAAAGSIKRNDDPLQVSRDGLVQFDVTVPSGQSFGIETRIEPSPGAGLTARRMLMQIDAEISSGVSRLILYLINSDGSVTAKTSGNFSTPASNRFIGSYRFIGGEHIAFCAGAKRIGFFDYDWLYPGHFGIRAGAGVSINSCVAELGYDRAVGMAVLDDYDMFGEVNDFGANEYSLGGNRADQADDGGNHPTIWGHYNVFLNAFRRLIDWFGSVSALPQQPGYARTEVINTNPIGKYDYIQVLAASVAIAGDQFAVGVDNANLTGGSFNDTQYGVTINGGDRITVTGTSIAVTFVRKNAFSGSVNDTIATLNLTVPAPGAYFVTVRGSGTAVGGQSRYNLFAFAEPVK